MTASLSTLTRTTARTARTTREARPARSVLGKPTSASLHAAAMLGVTLDARGRWTDAPSDRRRAAPAECAARRLLRLLGPGEVALVTGPSGGGKTTLLKAMQRLLRSRGLACVCTSPVPASCMVARLGCDVGDLDAWLGTLSQVGLAEAGAILSRVGALSAGQRYRVELAFALWRAAHVCVRARGQAVTVVADEFTTALDRLTAHSVCVGVRRLVARSRGVRAVVATAHLDTLAMLRPHVHAHVDLDGAVTIERRHTSTRTTEGAPCG